MTDYAFILTQKYGQYKWAMNGDDYSGLVWMDKAADLPSKEQLDEEYTEWKAANDYISNRKAEYPTIEEVVVALREYIGENRPEALQAVEVKVQAVKAKYPKPEKV